MCTIIPLHVEDVLRKGSGTLCENLLMVEAHHSNIIFPNKSISATNKFYENHLIDSETYVGGHVEALASGVYRNDIPMDFKIERKQINTILGDVDEVIKYTANKRKFDLATCTNLEEVRKDIVSRLLLLRDEGVPQTVLEQGDTVGYARRREKCTIVHVDVAAMYPNIIISNRLQPHAIVNEEICAACCHNKVENDCKKLMEWKWRGEIIPANRHEYNLIKTQIESEKVSVGDEKKHYFELPRAQQDELLKARLKEYSRRVYKKTHQTVTVKKMEMICMRENSFYVDTVLAFRDRRYVYKGLLKKAQIALSKAKAENASEHELQECEKEVVMYDSMQLAHKCILNSFYGYVMRKGSRWQSMEMAGVVTRTGHRVIAQARDVLSNIGQPLELDTDGIWTAFPETFPSSYRLTGPGKSVLVLSFPCEMLNRLTALKFSNRQYQTLIVPEGVKDSERKMVTADSKFEISSKCTIEFEVDGPYKAMVLPASKEKGKSIKKRYAVFHLDGKLAELKGFEMKRRGELKLIKIFQSTVFSYFLHGATLPEVYDEVTKVARQFMSYLTTKGENMADDEILDLLTESSNMSRSLTSYAGAKTCQVTTAKRLVEFLGKQIGQSKGLKCAYIIANRPLSASVTERAIPVPIFSADEGSKTFFLSKWLKAPPAQHRNDLRGIIDWEYYITRLESCIQKLITIPSALQGIPNPMPEVRQPEWLEKEVSLLKAKGRQANLVDLFQSGRDGAASVIDIESLADEKGAPGKAESAAKQGELENGAAQPEVKKRLRDEINFEFKDKVPNFDRHFDRWLRYMKRYWRALRDERRRRRNEQAKAAGNPATEETDASAAAASSPQNRSSVPRYLTTSLTDFYSRKEKDILRQEWNVIQIAETLTPGIYRLWALTGKNLVSVSLTVDRTFYVNSLIEFPEDRTMTRVHFSPPRSHPERYLYQKTISEVEFINAADSLSTLALGTEIEGVYETKTPLDFRAVMCLGAVCRLKARTKRRTVQQLSFSLGNFERLPKSATYLQNCEFRLLFLYHVHRGQESVIGLYHLSPEELASDGVDKRKMHLITVNPFPETNANVVRALRERAPDLEVKLRREVSNVLGFAELGRILRKEQERAKQPTLLIIQSDSSTISGLYSIPAVREFPCIRMPFNESDSLLGDEGAAAEGSSAFFGRWQLNSVSVMQQRSEEVLPWFESQLECARAANIPIGNFDDDYASTILDVLFGRALSENHYLLWASSSREPDLGGNADDLELPLSSAPQELVREGSYHDGVSITLEMNALAIDSILEAPAVADIEGTTHIFSALMHNPQIDGDFAAAATLLKTTDGSEVARQFMLLRQMVSKWVKELEEQPFNDLLLSHLPRWLNNTRSRLYEPAMVQMVDSFMKKIFHRVMLELEKLGAKVVYGSFDKVIIATKKRTLADAKEYINFLFSTLRKKQLFEFITLVPVQFWSPLIFLDKNNFAGFLFGEENGGEASAVKPAPAPKEQPVKIRRIADDDDEEEGDATHRASAGNEEDKKGDGRSETPSTAEDNTGKSLSAADSEKAAPVAKVRERLQLTNSWNIADYLPELVRKVFLVLVAEFLINTKAVADENLGTSSTDSSEVAPEIGEERGFSTAQYESRESKELSGVVVQRLLPEKFQQKMFMAVQQLSSQPPQAVTSLPLTSNGRQLLRPALAYVVFSTRVFELDSRLDVAVRRLRRNLLSVITVNEFSPDAQFEYPCKSFIVRSFYCTYCNAWQDLDLLRDSRLLRRHWSCSYCQKPISPTIIEQLLCDTLKQSVTAYQVQDLICANCHSVKSDSLSRSCNVCRSDKFCLREPKEKILEQLAIMRAIAEYYAFDELKELVKWYSD